MTRARGLGRGLAALIPESTFDDPGSGGAVDARMVPIDTIRPNPEQPRRHFDDAELRGLADSIRADGVLVPLVVRRHEGRYFLIAGERRLRAAGLAGLSEVPVVVREAPTAARQLALALVENLQRADLDPIEAAQGYARLVRDFGFTQAEVGERVGKDRSTVANAIRLLELPDFALDAVRDGHLSAGHARALLPVQDPVVLRALVGRIVEEGWSVRAVEREVRRHLRGAPAGKARPDRERAVAHVGRQLTRALGARVDIKPRKDGGGRIVIEYGDPAQLDALVERLDRR